MNTTTIRNMTAGRRMLRPDAEVAMTRDETDERLAGDLELISHSRRTDGAELCVVRRQDATQVTVINTDGVWSPCVLDNEQRRQLIVALGGTPEVPPVARVAVPVVTADADHAGTAGS